MKLLATTFSGGQIWSRIAWLIGVFELGGGRGWWWWGGVCQVCVCDIFHLESLSVFNTHLHVTTPYMFPEERNHLRCLCLFDAAELSRNILWPYLRLFVASLRTFPPRLTVRNTTYFYYLFSGKISSNTQDTKGSFSFFVSEEQSLSLMAHTQKTKYDWCASDQVPSPPNHWRTTQALSVLPIPVPGGRVLMWIK